MLCAVVVALALTQISAILDTFPIDVTGSVYFRREYDNSNSTYFPWIAVTLNTNERTLAPGDQGLYAPSVLLGITSGPQGEIDLTPRSFTGDIPKFSFGWLMRPCSIGRAMPLPDGYPNFLGADQHNVGVAGHQYHRDTDHRERPSVPRADSRGCTHCGSDGRGRQSSAQHHRH